MAGEDKDEPKTFDFDAWAKEAEVKITALVKWAVKKAEHNCKRALACLGTGPSPAPQAYDSQKRGKPLMPSCIFQLLIHIQTLTKAVRSDITCLYSLFM